MKIIRICVAIVAACVAPATIAEEAGVQDPAVEYDIDLRLGYYDKLRNPFTDSSAGNNPGEQQAGQERTMGLTRARSQIFWSLPGQSQLSVVLRPDALSSTDEEVTREFDGRAGRVYLQRPEIKLLDAYLIEKRFGEQLTVGIGVREFMVQRRFAYRSLLEFGLEPQLPQRSSVVEIEWRLLDFKADVSPRAEATGWIFKVQGFGGDQDRAENRSSSDDTFDQTPTSNDPHYGLLVDMLRLDGHFNKFMLTVGMSDNKYRETDDSGVTVASGKRNESFGQLANETLFRKLVVPTKVVVSYRIAKEKWKSTNVPIGSRTHQSVALTSSAAIGDEEWVLAGAHYGRSNFDNDTFATGYQLDLGFKQVIAKNLWTTFMIAEEHRELDIAGANTGGFVTSEGDTTKILRRFVLEFAYQFDRRR